MSLSPDKQSIQLSIDDTLSAAQLEALIVRLVTLRSHMEPAVHGSPPTIEDAHSRGNVSVQEDADIRFAALRGGGIRLWLRHVGFGWIAVQFSAEKARLFRDYLIKWAPGTAPMNLIDDDVDGNSTLQ